jgi:hypothetical protein
MGLGRQIIYFVGPHILDQPDEISGIRKIPVMHEEPDVLFVNVPVKMIYPVCVEKRAAALYAVYLVPLFQKKL